MERTDGSNREKAIREEFITEERTAKPDPSRIAALHRELDLFSEEAAQLDALLTAELAKFWAGPAFDACQAESRDNREIMLEAIGRYQSMLEEYAAEETETTTLPTDLLF